MCEKVRSPSPRLGRAEFERRFLAQFADPMFKALPQAFAAIADTAWEAYQQGRKSPNTRKAGQEFADPNYDLSVDWLGAREAIQTAQHSHRTEARSRILLVNCSAQRGKCWI